MTASDTVLPTIGRIRDDHLALMRDWRQITSDVDRVERAADLRRAVEQAGTGIGNDNERNEAQGIIDYWASAIASLPDVAYPEILELKLYTGSSARDIGTKTLATFKEMAPDAQRTTKELFLTLISADEAGYWKSPVDWLTLKRRVRRLDLYPVLEQFEATGAITRLPGDGADDDRFEVTDVGIAEDWPELRSWLDLRAEHARAQDYFTKRAEKWDASQRPRVDLLATRAELKSIERFSGDPLIDEFISASRRRLHRRRVTLGAGAAVLLVAIVAGAASIRSYVQAWTASATQDIQAANVPEPAEVAKVEATSASTTVINVDLQKDETLRGVMWLGSKDLPQVRAVQGRFVAFDDAREGTLYRAATNVYLRANIPNDDYELGDTKGIVPWGGIVRLKAAPEPIPRPGGTQYWAEVTVVPRVYIQYSGIPKSRVDALAKILADRGFDVPEPEVTDSAASLREIRYFHHDDKAIAAFLLSQLRSAPRQPTLPGLVQCRSFTGSRVQTTRYAVELWIGPRAYGNSRGLPAC